ncbi:MAG: P-loop NTPase [Desulfosarcina sp.]|jgi:flagellar biosynthesis protein FlhG
MALENTAHKQQSKRPGKMIAVGGAKGGIGKSLFVANLGVLLAQLGKKTVLVDLDLGGANLHLYMGVWSLPRRIDDFLTKSVPAIHDIMLPTKYGPMLIGGGGGKLGAANIHFSRKLKLLRALKAIDADYVILDLGGDTTFNILDFYLAADQGFVLTTCEPASYLDAYGFIKMSLHRKLSRLFGAESDYRSLRDFDVEQLIKAFVFSSSTGNGRQMSDLLDQMEAGMPAHHRLIVDLLDNYRPGTVVTMVKAKDPVDELLSRLGKVAARMLSIDLNHFGCMPFDAHIQQSAKDLVPCVAQAPDGALASALRRIVVRMEMA